MRSTHLTKRFSIAVAVIGVCGLAALPILASADREEGSSPVAQSDVAPTTGPTERTRELLGVFRRDQVPADRVLKGGESPTAAPDMVPGENPSLSRRSDPPGARNPVYIWPTDHGACWSTEGASSCGSNSDIELSGVLPTVSYGRPGAAKPNQLVGIARDGIPEISVDLANGASVTIPVSGNAFLVELDETPIGLRWKYAGTPIARSLPKAPVLPKAELPRSVSPGDPSPETGPEIENGMHQR
jgi:hypothetical protein